MASTTPNLNLKLLGTSLEDKEQYFEDWRQDINGEGEGSNMRIIDTAYGQLLSDVIEKVNRPSDDHDGVSGQVLSTNGDGTTKWVTPFMPTDELVADVINAWMDDHPEAVTTVEDGSISVAKLTSDIVALLNKVGTTETTVSELSTAVAGKIDNGYVEDGVGYFTSNGVIRFTMEGMGGGGGGGGGGGDDGGSATITYITDASIDCVYGDSVEIEYTFAASDSSGQTVGNGTGTWSVGGITVARNIDVRQGLNSFDIGPYLQPGPNRVKVSVSVDTGGTRARTASKTWTINAVNMYMMWNYNDAEIHTESFVDRWTVYGEIEKTTHTLLDGAEMGDIVTERSGAVQTMEIPVLSHGVHSIERWLTATVNDTEQSTPHLYHEAIFVEDGKTTPIIALTMTTVEMRQYDTLSIPYVVYDPSNIFTEVEYLVDGVSAGVVPNVDRSLQHWYYTPTVHGAQLLTIRCGTTSRVIHLNIEEVHVDVSEVPGYTFRFKASDFPSNSAVREWESNGISATFSQNFDWVNGGLQTETGSNGYAQQYFCIKAGTRMMINRKLFATDPRQNGMNYKMIFKAKNCRNYDANLMHCYADGVGIRVDAHKAYFTSSGTEVTVPYGEETYKELEFDVFPAPRQEGDGNYRYMMAWLDGVITSCRVYGASDNFVQSVANQENIILGSDDCDVHIYMIKAYALNVTLDGHIDNFIMDAPNAGELLARFNRNDILDVSGEINYEKLVDRNPDLRVWTWNIPYLTNGKKDKVPGCEFQQFWKNGDNYYNITGTGVMTVQGTSSVNYIRGAANTDVDFTSLTDGDGNDLLANGTQDETYGNNWFVEDEEDPGHAKVYTAEEAMEDADVETVGELGPEWVVIERDDRRMPLSYIKALGFKISDTSCPITYSNTKVNFASCEQVNNMCNAAWYQRFNPYPSMTARDCMEFEMGVQFIRDSGEVPDASHFALFGDDKYHMYSIANMGNSKKNIHVFHDLSNPTEVCIEINDNNADQMRMVSDDLSAEDWSGDVYFGMRYPDTKNPKQEVKDAWQRLVTWMATRNPGAATGQRLDRVETYEPYTFRGHDRQGEQVLRGLTISRFAGTYTFDTFERRMARMLSECEDYMVMDSFVYQFVYLERHTMVDNVCKNTFWSSTDLLHWDMSKAYDMDTSDGNNNQGQLAFDYGNEFTDYDQDGRRVFNGGDSVWFIFVGNLYEACRQMFTNREAAGAWSAVAYHEFLTSQQRKVPERCWVQCYWYDYLRTYEQGIVGKDDWMPFLDGGKKTHQRNHYEYYEELYDASKYRGTVSTSQKVNFRAYTPATWINTVSNDEGAPIYEVPNGESSIIEIIPNGTVVTVLEKYDEQWRKIAWDDGEYYILKGNLAGVEPSNDITVTMYNKMYLSANIGTTRPDPIKVERGVPYTLTFYDLGLLNNTLIEINTASMIQEIEGVEHLYPDTCVFSDAIRLRTLHIGSDAVGYENTYLRSLALTNNTMLEYLYAQNLPNANSNLDLTNCPSVIYLDASGSGFTGYEFAPGGQITTAIIERPTAIRLVELPYLTDEYLTINDLSSLISLHYENTVGVNVRDLIESADALQVVRVIGINWSMYNADLLDRLYHMQGIDDNGYTITQSVLAGYVYASTISGRSLNSYRDAWPGLTIDYDPEQLVEEHAVRFVNYDGTPIKDLYNRDYVQYVEHGSIPYDPVLRGEVLAPTYGPDAHYVYTYSGWDGINNAVLSPKTITASYTLETRRYTVRFFDRQGGNKLKEVTVDYGTEVVYNSDPHVFPESTDEESSYVYKVFTGWDKSTGYVTEDMDVFPVWSRNALPSPGEVELEDMTLAMISGVAKRNMASSYWTPKDHIDVRLGHDFDFSNVSSELLAENLWLDGSTCIRTNLKLFEADAPTFVLAIDYEFYSTNNGDTLVSCFDENGNEGFRLRYMSNRANLQWGDRNFDVSIKTRRNILALCHRQGSDNLYAVYDQLVDSAHVQDTVHANRTVVMDIPRARSTETDAVLAFGGIPLGSDGSTSRASGMIHWCKIWHGDLGNTLIKQLGTWIHETLRMEYIGANIYRIDSNETIYSAASFISNNLTDIGTSNSTMIDAQVTPYSYKNSHMRTLMTGILWDAIPYGWQALIKTTRFKACTNSSVETEVLNDKLYLPSIGEIMPNLTGNDAIYYEEGGIQIPWFVDDTSKVKFRPHFVPEDATIYRETVDPTLGNNVKEGDIWWKLGGNGNNNRYIYISKDTYEHRLVHVYNYPSPTPPESEFIIAANGGGAWLAGQAYYTRSATYNGTDNFRTVGATGSNGNGIATYGNGVCVCFSI